MAGMFSTQARAVNFYLFGGLGKNSLQRHQNQRLPRSILCTREPGFDCVGVGVRFRQCEFTRLRNGRDVMKLRRLLTREALQVLTSATTFARSAAYVAQGRVISCTETADWIEAVVQGGQTYQVRFWVRGKTLAYSCTCPFAAEGACCKHCVAVGLRLRDK